tara:strand:- start:849 stop:2387 length:1539 start_codon:yes stop_codon:yes gene_type:complete
MDETNPVYENFRNKMEAFGQPIKGTTRRISASKFLGRDNIEQRIENNSKKINLITRVLKARRIRTGENIASLSESSSVRGIERSIMDIKETMSSILQTLEAQDKFETQKFLDTQRRLENEKRRKREGKLELGKKVKNSIQKSIDKVVSPIKNIFSAILGGIVKLFLGKFLIDFIKFLANPRNKGLLNFISGAIETTFNVLDSGIGKLLVALPLLLGALQAVSGLLGIQGIAGGITGGAGGFLGAGRGKGKGLGAGSIMLPKRNSVPITTSAGSISRGFKFPKIPRIRFNEGGVVPGSGNTDTVPAMLTPGEFVVKKDAVGILGLPFLERLNKSFSQFKNFYNQGRNVRFPNENTAKLKDLIKDDFSQITRSNKAFKEGAKGIRGARPLKAFTPNMMKTGPTPLFRQSIERPFRSLLSGGAKGVAKKIPILDLLLDLAFPKPLADGTLTGNMGAVPNLMPIDVNSVSKQSMADFGSLPSIPEPDQSVDTVNDILDVSLNSPDIEKMETLGMMQ